MWKYQEKYFKKQEQKKSTSTCDMFAPISLASMSEMQAAKHK